MSVLNADNPRFMHNSTNREHCVQQEALCPECATDALDSILQTNRIWEKMRSLFFKPAFEEFFNMVLFPKLN